MNKNLSSPFSTGGGGYDFEINVQTAFTVVMLARGFAPCLPQWPIKKIKLQGKHKGFATDDFIAYASDGSNNCKLLAQIKHEINIIESDTDFRQVMNAAWHDFNNKELFNPTCDAIALITGPLNDLEIRGVRPLLEQARVAKNATDFITRISTANFSNEHMRDKLKVFRTHLSVVKETAISDDELWHFLKCFHLLGYDLDIKAGVNSSLLKSLIGQYSFENAHSLWCQILVEVQDANKKAGELSPEKMPKEIRDAFSRPAERTFPIELAPNLAPTGGPAGIAAPFPAELAEATLLGSWSETTEGDKQIIDLISSAKYQIWVRNMRENLHAQDSTLKLKNGIWEIPDRLSVWQGLGYRIYDDTLETFYNIAITVLSEHDPKFDLPPDQQWAANVYGKVLKYSKPLRKGIAESLALLGSHQNDLKSCTQGKPEAIAFRTVHDLLYGADWVIWASLYDLLPLLAEAAPKAFFDAIDEGFLTEPNTFKELFAHEGSGATGLNYMTGILWALETLAWEPDYLSQVILILGKLAETDKGGSWANRPINSLITILLPWAPQTCAPISRRITAVEALCKDYSKAAWQLLLAILPSSQQITMGSRKPEWRNTIPKDLSDTVTRQEYWEQIRSYATLTKRIAASSVEKLRELLSHMQGLLPDILNEFIALFNTPQVLCLSEEERLPLWNELCNLISKHKRHPNANWAMKSELLNKITAIADSIAPKSPFVRHQRLFNRGSIDLYEGTDDLQKQEEQLLEKRKNAIQEILDIGGIKTVLEFVKKVESAHDVGSALGFLDYDGADEIILPALLLSAEKNIADFTSAYILARLYKKSLTWADSIDYTSWTPNQIGSFFACFAFSKDTWKRISKLLPADELPYWLRAKPFPYKYSDDDNLPYAIDRLIEFGRPNAAITCIYHAIFHKRFIDSKLCIHALESIKSIHEEDPLDGYYISELIKTIQNDTAVNKDKILLLEWTFLPLLSHNNEVWPKSLENKLASDPAFFCKFLRMAFKSKKALPEEAKPSKEKIDLATRAYTLLDNWRIPPGKKQDGSFSEDDLRAWWEAVKSECEQTGHLEVAISIFGQILFHAPDNPDGFGKVEPIEKLLNEETSIEMRRSFIRTIFNSRGVYHGTKGDEERKLSEEYKNRAKLTEERGFPRLAAALRDLAETYKRDADREAAE